MIRRELRENKSLYTGVSLFAWFKLNIKGFPQMQYV